MRVGANCRINIFVLLGQLDGPFQRPAVWIAGAYIQNGGNARIARTLKQIGYSGPLTIERELSHDPNRQRDEIKLAVGVLENLKLKILG